MAIRTLIAASFSLFLLASCGGGSGGQTPAFSISYQASAGGQIEGDVEQEVRRGDDAAPVVASPDPGYRFTSWSDGWLQAARHDQDVQADISVSATFERNAFRVGGTVSGLLGTGLTLSLNGLETLELDTNGSFQFESFIDIGSSYSVTMSGQPQGAAGEYCSLTHAEGADVNTDISSVVIACNLLLAGEIPWQESVHGGVLVVIPQTPSKAVVNWQAQTGETYSLLVSSSADLPTDHPSILRHDNVSPGFELDGLSPGLPVYLALESPQGVIAWTSFVPRTWTWSSIGGLYIHVSQAVGSAGQRFLGAEVDDVRWQPVGTGSSLALSGHAQGGWPLAAAEASGNRWQSGDPEYSFTESGQVRAVVADGAGGWYLAGDFSEVGGLSRNGLAHVDAIGKVTDWAPQVSGQVFALAVSHQTGGNVIYVGGRFSQAGGEARGGLAAFDQLGQLLPWELDVRLLSGPGEVEAIAMLEDGSSLVVGGRFDEVVDQGDQVLSRDNLVMIDLDAEVSAWSAGTDGRVLDILIRDGVIYIAGEFGDAGPAGDFESRQLLAAFSVEGVLTPWQAPASGARVRSLAALGQGADVRIYAGGDFEISDNGEFAWNIASLDVEGRLQPWMISDIFHEHVNAVAAADYQGVETVYVAGMMCRYDPYGPCQPINGLRAFDPLGQPRDWLPENALGQFQALALDAQSGPAGVTLYVGGGASNAGWGSFQGMLAGLDEHGQLENWFPVISPRIQKMTLLEDDVTLVFANESDIAAIRHGETETFWSANSPGGTPTVLAAASRGEESLIVVNDWERLAAYQLGGSRLEWYPEPIYYPVGALAIDYRESDFTVYAGFGNDSSSGNYRRLVAFDGGGNTLDWGIPLRFYESYNNQAYVNSLSLLGSGDDARIYAGGVFRFAGEEPDEEFVDHRIQLTAMGGLTSWRASASDIQSFQTVTMVVQPVTAGERAFVIGRLDMEPDVLQMAVFDAAGEGALLSMTPLPVSGQVASFAVTEEAGSPVYHLIGDFEIRADSGHLLRKGVAVFAADGTLLPR